MKEISKRLQSSGSVHVKVKRGKRVKTVVKKGVKKRSKKGVKKEVKKEVKMSKKGVLKGKMGKKGKQVKVQGTR